MQHFAQWLQATPLSIAIQSTSWLIPLLQSIHIVMIGLVFVAVLLLVLRVLGLARTDELPSVVWSRFAPWLRRGVIVLALTGLVLIISEPVREFTAISFWLKMLLLALGLSAIAVLGKALRRDALASRGLAVLTLLVWIAVIFFGRAIAYDVEVWGALSFKA